MKSRNLLVGGLLGVLLISACAPGPSTTGGTEPRGATTSQPGKTLVVLNQEPATNFSPKGLVSQANTTRSKGFQFLNADLTFSNEQGLPYPVLAERLPELNTDTWQFFPNGKMETTYRIKPNLTWHDGEPLTAEDWAFSWRVYANPEFVVDRSRGFRFIEDVVVPDPHTVIIRWNQLFPEAVDSVQLVPPLPRHILESPYQELSAQQFIALPFWMPEYIGAGPYRLDRLELGSFFEATAFAGFVFGRPKIERIKVMSIPNIPTMIANLLAGEGHYTMEGPLYGEDGAAIERQWGPTGGTVYYELRTGRGNVFQMRPDVAGPPQLATDRRVRQAVAYAIDRQEIMETVTVGKGLTRDFYTHPKEDYANAVSRAVTVRYPYDPRRAEQLLMEAGFIRGADRFWVTPTGERFTMKHGYLPASSNERESLIMVDRWRQLGIEATGEVFEPSRPLEDRILNPGVFGGSLLPPVARHYDSRTIPSAATRWVGENRGGYANPEINRLIDAYQATLDRNERIQLVIQMEQIVMEDLPAIPMYWSPDVTAFVAGLKAVPENPVVGAGVERRIWEWYWE